jgi:hypothetical protein
VNALDELVSADELVLAQLAFDYRVDPAVVSPGTTTLSSVCTSKHPGSLTFSVRLSDLGFSGADFDGVFEGQLIGSDAQGRPLVRWSIDQDVNKYLPSYDATLDHIQGSFDTVVLVVNPAVELTSCGGVDRFYNVGLVNAGVSRLTLTVTKTIVGIDQTATITVENLTLAAFGGQPLTLSVRISVPDSPCSTPVVSGGQFIAYAVTKGVPTGVVETYQWTVTGGLPVGPTNEVKLVGTASGEILTLTVLVTAGNQTAKGTNWIPIIPSSHVPMLEALCRLMHPLERTYWIDPLGDPPRDIATRLEFRWPSTEELRAFATKLKSLLEAVEEATKPMR